MTEILCPDCGSPDIKAVANIPHTYESWGSLHYQYSHLMQCRVCKTVFEINEECGTGELLPYEPTSI